MFTRCLAVALLMAAAIPSVQAGEKAGFVRLEDTWSECRPRSRRNFQRCPCPTPHPTRTHPSDPTRPGETVPTPERSDLFPEPSTVPPAPSVDTTSLPPISAASAAGLLGAQDRVPAFMGDFFGPTGTNVTVSNPSSPLSISTLTEVNVNATPPLRRLGTSLFLEVNGRRQDLPFDAISPNPPTQLGDNQFTASFVQTQGTASEAEFTSAIATAISQGTGTPVSVAFGSPNEVFDKTVASQNGVFRGGTSARTEYLQTLNLIVTPVASPVVIPVANSVGNVKLSENSSPLPRDRFFINYSLFDNVPLTGNGVTVNRLTPGFEKTLFGGDTSVEMRFPFATTMDSDVNGTLAGDLGATNRSAVEFGDLTFTLKQLLVKRRNYSIAAGVGVSAPTSDDFSYSIPSSVIPFTARLDSDGSAVTGFDQQLLLVIRGGELLRVQRRAFHVLPFFGGVYAPNRRFFAQGILQLDIDANGDPVLAQNSDGELEEIGVLQQQNFVYLDVSTGYWLYDNARSRNVTGVAGILELHYNHSLNAGDIVSGNGFAVGQDIDFQQLNAVVGGTIEMWGDDYLNLGFAFPIGSGSDQTFDGELRVNYSHRFGPRSRQARPSSL